MVTIDFYNYDRRTYAVNKVLANPTSMSGVLRDKTNVMMPELLVRFNRVFDFNYCYIRELNRYYYIVDVTIVDATTYKIRLSLDVLKTYETEIMAATGTIIESDDADKYISNRQKIYDVRPNVERIDYTPNLFDATGSMIMVTLKGN